MDKVITIIPKKETPIINLETGQRIKRRVCAYARVSTDLDDQKNSLNAQKEEYQTRITKNPEWDFVGLYFDEGISGTSIKKREGFQKMLKDAYAGKIDLILVKSISRFARNTVDCLKTLRELRNRNIEVFFDKENISTNDPKVDIMLTIFASFAQEESKSISENVKWGVRKRMVKGQRKMSTKTLIGYEEAEDGTIVINEDEKELIKKIFNMYICGYSIPRIIEYLNDNGHVTKTNKPFLPADVWRILNNEKYCGDLVLQKTVVVDFLDHKAYKNDGIVDKVHIQNHHEPIISRKEFIYLQALKKYRWQNKNEIDYANVNPLNRLIYCEECLRPLKKIKQHPGKAYERYVMTCKQDKVGSDTYRECSSSTLDYDLAIEAAKRVFNRFFEKPKDLEINIEKAYNTAVNTQSYCDKVEAKEKEIKELEDKLKELLKKQLEEDNFTKYEAEFASIKKDIAKKKDDLKQYEDDEIVEYTKRCEIIVIHNYLENNKLFAPSLVKKVTNLIIYRKDRSLRFVLGESKISVSDVILDRILEANPIYEETITVDGRDLRFDVVRLGGDTYED